MMKIAAVVVLSVACGMAWAIEEVESQEQPKFSLRAADVTLGSQLSILRRWGLRYKVNAEAAKRLITFSASGTPEEILEALLKSADVVGIKMDGLWEIKLHKRSIEPQAQWQGYSRAYWPQWNYQQQAAAMPSPMMGGLVTLISLHIGYNNGVISKVD